MCKYVEDCKHQEFTTCPSCGGEGSFEPPFFSDDTLPSICRTCHGEGYVCVKRAAAWHRLRRDSD